MNRKADILFKVLSLVVTIFLLALIAISFLKSRKVSAMEACIANMRQLEGAREQALLAGETAMKPGILWPRLVDPIAPLLWHTTDIVIPNKVSQ